MPLKQGMKGFSFGGENKMTMSLELPLFPTRYYSELLFSMKLGFSAAETFSCFFIFLVFLYV